MLKKGILAVVALGAMQLVNAQTIDSVVTKELKTTDKYVVETNHFKHNWFIGAQVGAQMLFADHTKQMDFLDRISPAFEVNFGKWFTPGIGVRFGISAYNLKGVAGWTDYGVNAGGKWNERSEYNGFTGEPGERSWYKDGEVISGNQLLNTNMKFLHAHADVMFNLSQMICGYKRDRFYSFIPYASLGFIHSLNKPMTSFKRGGSWLSLKEIQKAPMKDEYTHEVTGSLGLLNKFRLSNRLDLDLDIRANYANDRMDQQIGGRWGEGFLQAFVGLTCNLGKNYWEQSTITTIRVNENVLAELRERVNTLEVTNDDIRKQLEEALNREVTPDNVCGMPLLVTFHIDRWKLRNKDRVNLGFLAEVLKANPKMIYNIVGFADKGTGSVRRNIFLAKKRAEVIYNCLVNEFGVSEAQLTKDSKGGVANMYYDDPRCSRAVLLKIAE